MGVAINSDMNQISYMDETPYSGREEVQATIEKTLNILGYIPVVSIYSGMLRKGYGGVCLIVDVATIFFLQIKTFYKGHTPEGDFEIHRHLWYSVHDFLNIIRGDWETTNYLSAYYVNNVLCIIYDLIVPRFAYPSESTFKIS
jgi:hypothetical protein